ncbi:HPr(Ser) kinase/phosphatase, partial [Paenibacillus glucanolyticus]
MAKKVKVSELVQQFQLEVIAGEEGLKRQITTDDLNRPGLEMAGYFEYHPRERVQLMGRTELAFFGMLKPEERKERMRSLCTEETPCIVVTRSLEVPEELVELGNERGLPILRSSMATTILTSRFTSFLE